jgi:phospholipase A-2-activating protein
LKAINYSTVRLWTSDGEQVDELNGHTSFIYSLNVLPSGEVVSCGEDRSVRIWLDATEIQTLTQPCISVWAVGTSSEGDIAAGGSDGVIRIFTRNPDRFAPSDVMEVYNCIDNRFTNQQSPILVFQRKRK